MNILELIDRHIWFTALVAAPIAVLTFYIMMVLAETVSKFYWARLMRMISIRKHGWPPSHCDADGDPFRPASKGEQELRDKVIACIENPAGKDLPSFLEWIADRLELVYGDNPNVDYVISLRKRAEALEELLNLAKTP